MDGSKVGKNSALIGDEDVGALLIQRVARLRAESAELMAFIFQQVHSPRFHAYVDRINTSSGIPHISARQIKDYPIHFTSEAEQRRIADCLSSLDTQITAESNQLAALKTHKQGLMQQLFPAPEAD
jgi:type I restriction enzyme S subunit